MAYYYPSPNKTRHVDRNCGTNCSCVDVVSGELVMGRRVMGQVGCGTTWHGRIGSDDVAWENLAVDDVVWERLVVGRRGMG